MSGYRGDRYGEQGSVRERNSREERDDYDKDAHRGAAEGNLMGRAERDVAAMFQRGEGQDPRARQAASDWKQRFGREGHEGSYAQDAGYQRYRERHLAELDRDYDEWCREREQQFHQEFQDWRSRRRQVSNQPGGPDLVASDRDADRFVGDESRRPSPRQKG